MTKPRTNTRTEQNTEDTGLLTYRVLQLELAWKEVSGKLDQQDNLKRSDIMELRDTILSRIAEIRTDLQKQIDAKADKDQVDDLRSLVKGVGAILGTVIAAIVVYYLTHKP